MKSSARFKCSREQSDPHVPEDRMIDNRKTGEDPWLRQLCISAP